MKQKVLTPAERVAWQRLAQTENIGPITFRNLLMRFSTAEKALEAVPHLASRGGAKRPMRLYEQSRAEDDISRAEAFGATYIAICEPDYPENLRQSPAPPPLICVKGNKALLHQNHLAIVGARNASAAGLRFTRILATQAGEAGLIIVSGLARGIDTAAHEASLAKGTIAVIAGGIDHVYPPENVKLQMAIAEQGLLLCEVPPGTTPRAESFPRRNRIIAGLAQGTAIIEAALRSGSLSTARFANEAGREVFAVPGSPLDPRCEGTNGLIKDGAHMLTKFSDILEVFQTEPSIKTFELFEDAEELSGEISDNLRNTLLQLLSPTPIDLDDLVRETKVPSFIVQSALLELELAGRILRSQARTFSKLS